MTQTERPAPGTPGEQALYDALQPALCAAMDRWQLPRSLLRLRGAKSYASVLVGSALLCRLYAGKRPGLEYPGADEGPVPADYPAACVHRGRDKTRLDLPEGADPARALAPVLQALAGRLAAQFPKTFDCCHRYLACSDAGRCVNPDAAQALGCGYKRVLTEGKCYYGEHRNV